MKKASFLETEICDCDFTGSNLEGACLAVADFDNAAFVNANLCNADFAYAKRTYWSDFTNADTTGLSTADVSGIYFVLSRADAEALGGDEENEEVDNC